MRKWMPALFVLSLLGGLLLSGCSSPPENAKDGDTNPVPTLVDTPVEYAEKSNPLVEDVNAAADGEITFRKNCASCHGEGAKGDGPAATSLDPSPPDLEGNGDRLSDGYLFWRISEGGMIAPFHSAMPAWKTILTEDQIWQVIAYLRSLNG